MLEYSILRSFAVANGVSMCVCGGWGKLEICFGEEGVHLESGIPDAICTVCTLFLAIIQLSY